MTTSSHVLSAVVLCFSALCVLNQKGLQGQVYGTSGQLKVTLAEVIEKARKDYPAVQAAEARQKAAQSGVGVARTAYLPRTDLLWQTNRATANNVYGLLLPQGVVPSISGPVIASDVSRSAWSSAGGALFSWQPFDFGARAAKVNAAEKGSEAATQAKALAALEAGTEAGSAFLDLAAAQQLVTVAHANLRRLEAFHQAVHVLVDNTLRPGADASQADAQLALARNQWIQAQTQEAVSTAALTRFLGAVGAPIAIDPTPLLSSLPPAEAGSTGAASHPAVIEESALVEQQTDRQRSLDRSYVPAFSTLGAVSGRGAGTSLDGRFPGGTSGLAPDTFNWAAGVQVSFSAFDFFLLREEKKAQQQNVLAERARYTKTVDDISAAIEQAKATLAGARQVAANTPMELSAARISEQQQQARYRSGLATVVDVSAAESLLAQAESDDAIARLSVWRAALGLAAAQGDIEPFLRLLNTQP